VEREPERDRLAVAQRMIGQQLELVGRPVAEVERSRAAGLEGIAGSADVLEVQLGAATDRRLERRELALRQRGGVALERREEHRIADQRDLDRLRETGQAIAQRQAAQPVE